MNKQKKAYANIDEYIAQFPESIQEKGKATAFGGSCLLLPAGIPVGHTSNPYCLRPEIPLRTVIPAGLLAKHREYRAGGQMGRLHKRQECAVLF